LRLALSILFIALSFAFQGFEIFADRVETALPLERRSVIHRSASANAAVLMLQVRTRPDFCETTSPEDSSTARCCITAGSDMASGRLSSLTDAGLAASRSTIARRVGSARAWNARSSVV
jgi:hypothetical protein